MVPPTLSGPDKVRVWSAASSSGEEAYSAAMVLAGVLPPSQQWEILAPISAPRYWKPRAVACIAWTRRNVFHRHISKKWCLKGKGRYDGTLLIDKTCAAM